MTSASGQISVQSPAGAAIGAAEVVEADVVVVADVAGGELVDDAPAVDVVVVAAVVVEVVADSSEPPQAAATRTAIKTTLTLRMAPLFVEPLRTYTPSTRHPFRCDAVRRVLRIHRA